MISKDTGAWIRAISAKFARCIVKVAEMDVRYIPVIPMLDEPVHDNEHPFCDDIMCPCKADFHLIIEYVYQPVQDGLLTAEEGKRIYFGKQL